MLKQILCCGLLCGISSFAVAAMDTAMQPRQAIYYWAQKANVTNLLRLKQLGYSLDARDQQGITPACEAVYKNDVIAFKTLQTAGADLRDSCLYAIPLSIRQKFEQAYIADHSVIFNPEEKVVPALVAVDVAPVLVQENETQKDDVLPKENDEVLQALSSDIEKAEEGSEAETSNSVFRPYLALNFLYGKTKGDFATSVSANKTDFSEGTGGLSLAFGYRLNDVRLELEGRVNDELSTKVLPDVEAKLQTNTLMFNAYYDIPTSMALRPYIMAGIGGAYNVGKLSASSVHYKNHNTDLAWQLGCGLSYTFMDHLFADLGYRYTNYGTINVVRENNVDYDLKDITAHNVTLGLRYEL